MPLKPPQPPPTNQRDWDKWARSVAITPNDNSTSTSSLQDGAATNAKLADMPALSVKARPSNTAGDPVDLQAASDATFLQRRGGTLLFDVLTASDITADMILQHMNAIRSFLLPPRPDRTVDDAELMLASRVFRTR